MITSWEEYNEIETLCDSANDKIISGQGEIGQHYMLMHILSKHGIVCLSRIDTISMTRKLLDEFIAAQNGTGVT